MSSTSAQSSRAKTTRPYVPPVHTGKTPLIIFTSDSSVLTDQELLTKQWTDEFPSTESIQGHLYDLHHRGLVDPQGPSTYCTPPPPRSKAERRDSTGSVVRLSEKKMDEEEANRQKRDVAVERHELAKLERWLGCMATIRGNREMNKCDRLICGARAMYQVLRARRCYLPVRQPVFLGMQNYS